MPFATANLPAGSQGLQSSTRCKGGGYLNPSASTGCSSPMFLSWKKFGDLQGYSKLEKRGVFSQGCKLSPSKTRLLGWSSWEPPSSPEVKEDDFTYWCEIPAEPKTSRSAFFHQVIPPGAVHKKALNSLRVAPETLQGLIRVEVTLLPSPSTPLRQRKISFLPSAVCFHETQRSIVFLRPKILFSNKVFSGPCSQRLLEWEVQAASLVFLGTYAKNA